VPTCQKGATGGSFCVAHGGGKRCSHEDCDKPGHFKGLCALHGGGKLCQTEGCTKWQGLTIVPISAQLELVCPLCNPT